jgi:hypothetical protein
MAKPIVGQTSKVVTKPIFDADGNVVAYTEVQNGHQSELMRQNVRHAEDRRLPLAGHTQRHWRHVAEIPNVFVNKLMREGIWDDPERREEWLKRECPRDFLVGGKYS